MKKIAAIHIDAINQKVEMIRIEPKLQSYYNLLKVSMIEGAYGAPWKGDVLYIDEEGLINETEHSFYIEGAPQPYFGSGIIVGGTRTGNDCSCRTILEELKVKFFKTRLELAIYYRSLKTDIGHHEPGK
jgi:hypothetical protein